MMCTKHETYNEMMISLILLVSSKLLLFFGCFSTFPIGCFGFWNVVIPASYNNNNNNNNHRHYYEHDIMSVLLHSSTSFEEPQQPPQPELLSLSTSPRLRDCQRKQLLVQPQPNLYILGTVHIGSESSKDVIELLQTIQPDIVIVEMSPSRFKRIQQQQQVAILDDGNNNSSKNNDDNQTNYTSSNNNNNNNDNQQLSFVQTLFLLPALIERGWSAAGVTTTKEMNTDRLGLRFEFGMSGMLVASTILWPAMVRRSLTVKEELTILGPRQDEFVTAVQTVAEMVSSNTNSSSVRVVAADWELDDLLWNMAYAMLSSSPSSMSSSSSSSSSSWWWGIQNWFQLGWISFQQFLHLYPKDPIERRQHHESILDWSNRRRNITTARSSKVYGQQTFPLLHHVLVDLRERTFHQKFIKKKFSASSRQQQQPHPK